LEKCNLINTCFFYNEMIPDMPHTKKYFIEMYCKRMFTACARYRYAKLHGQDNVPKFLFPVDMIVQFNFVMPECANSSVENAKLVNVLNIDGTFGTVSSASLDELVKTSRIAAYKFSEGWVEVRRKINSGYRGQERRTRSLF
jgi:hypothetical protein